MTNFFLEMDVLDNIEGACGWQNHEGANVELPPVNPKAIFHPPPPPPKKTLPHIPPHTNEPPPKISQNPPHNPRPLWEHSAKYHIHNPIRMPPIDVPNFSINSLMFGLVESRAQFSGNPLDDPHAHLYKLEEICNLGPRDSVHQELAHLALFPFSLKGQAKEWFMSLPHHHLKSWDDIQTEFLKQYFPIGRYLELKVRVAQFKQELNESFEDAWGRFKNILKACPNHGYSLEMQVQLFCRGLYDSSRKQVDAACQGTFWMSTAQEAYTAIESATSLDRLWESGPKENEALIGIEQKVSKKVNEDLSQLEHDLDHNKRLLEKLSEVVGAQVANVNLIVDSIVKMSLEIGNMKETDMELKTKVDHLEALMQNVRKREEEDGFDASIRRWQDGAVDDGVEHFQEFIHVRDKNTKPKPRRRRAKRRKRSHDDHLDREASLRQRLSSPPYEKPMNSKDIRKHQGCEGKTPPPVP